MNKTLANIHQTKNDEKTNILVVGFGYVGKQLTKQLLVDFNCNVWSISRSKIECSYSENHHHIIDDLTKPARDVKLPSTINFVVYAVAANESTPNAYYNAYILALRNLLNRLRYIKAHPKKIFFISSTAVYHQNKGQWVTEESATNPSSFRGRSMLDAEFLLKASEFDVTILRFGGIYGPGRSRIISMVKQQIYSTNLISYSNRIHLEDGVNIVVHLMKLLNKEVEVDGLYLIVDSEPAPMQEIMQWVATNLNISLLLENKIPATIQNKRCSNARILKSGYCFIYPNYKLGLKKLL